MLYSQKTDEVLPSPCETDSNLSGILFDEQNQPDDPFLDPLRSQDENLSVDEPLKENINPMLDNCSNTTKVI